MSNETDLDWLARNVHEWPAGEHQPWCYVYMTYGGVMKAAGNFLDAVANPAMITIDQWISRRAELQNKPSWDDFGESAKFMAQDSDGAWMAFESEPAANYHVWSSMRGWCGYAREGRDRCRGEVLGDWRDTLEKRPEEFKPFTSVEGNQEQNMKQQHDMKQDNGWFERGELPPVGVVCEAYLDLPPQWIEAEIVAHKDGFAIGWCKSVMKGCHGDKASEFRPVRTERDVLLSIIVEEMNRYDTDGKLADAILAAGFSLMDK